MIAFSFDDGPAYDYNGSNSTKRILDVLENIMHVQPSLW